MQQTITITPKWQVYIPVAVRETLGLEKPGKAVIRVEKGKMVIRPQKSSLLKMAGKYRTRRPVKKLDIEKIRAFVDYSQL